MGQVAAVFNMVPESPEVDIQSVMSSIPSVLPEGVTINNMVAKPFAFGLKVIEITCVMNDTAGIIEKLEEALKTVPQVQGVEFITMTLI